MTWTVNLSPVNYSSLACLKVKISALSTFSKLYLKLNTFTCPIIEHTTGLCKSYEEKHIALQEKLRESSLRCEYYQKIEEKQKHSPDHVISWYMSCVSGSSGSGELAGRLHPELQWTEASEWTHSPAQTSGSGPRDRLHTDHHCLYHCRQVQSTANRWLISTIYVFELHITFPSFRFKVINAMWCIFISHTHIKLVTVL